MKDRSLEKEKRVKIHVRKQKLKKMMKRRK